MRYLFESARWGLLSCGCFEGGDWSLCRFFWGLFCGCGWCEAGLWMFVGWGDAVYATGSLLRSSGAMFNVPSGALGIVISSTFWLWTTFTFLDAL